MKRIFATIGVAAIGSTALQQAQAVDLSPQDSTKPWSVSVALRGFYDDNYLNAPRDGDVRESWGFSVTPTVGLNIPLEQTYIGLDLTYSGQYYEDDSHWDQSFIAAGILNHSFTEQVNLEVKDRFVYSDRPELTDPDFSTIDRTDNSGINNRGDIAFSMGLSPRLGLVVAYENALWSYQNDNPAAESTPPPVGTNPSLAALLNRMQHLIPINLRYQAAPATVAFVGFSYGQIDYTSDEFLGTTVAGPQKADVKNNRSYYGYVGVEHNFNPLFSGGLRGGAQYTDYYNDDLTGSDTTPYGDVHLNYLYATGSSAEVGYTISQGATDVYAPAANGQITQSRLVNSIYGRVNHQLLPNLHASLYGQWQFSQYYGGAYDETDQTLWLFGASLRYDFNRFLAADLGYTLDYMDSDIPSNNYTRNRVYLGLTASY